MYVSHSWNFIEEAMWMLTRKRKNKRNWEAENLMGLSAGGFSLWLLPPLPHPPQLLSHRFLVRPQFSCTAFSQALSVNLLPWRPRDPKRFGRQKNEVQCGCVSAFNEPKNRLVRTHVFVGQKPCLGRTKFDQGYVLYKTCKLLICHVWHLWAVFRSIKNRAFAQQKWGRRIFAK